MNPLKRKEMSSTGMDTSLLEGKVAAVTGGVTGIGRAIVEQFIIQGAKVVVNHLDNEESNKQYAKLHRGLYDRSYLQQVKGDISKPEVATALVAKAVEVYGKLDVFVSNAGICEFAEFLDVDPTLLDKTISVNLNGAYLAVQAAARQMVKQGHGGSIIGISSISALVGGAQQTHYTPTKAGVLSLMQSAACALGKHRIRCNALLPGTIETALNEKDLADPKKLEYMEGRIPLGRVGIPEDMAGPAVFLASDMSRYVTGAQLLVDGGAFVNFQ